MQESLPQNAIVNKAPKPAGLVPKNLQAFLLVGLALVMVLIMALTGHKRPTPVAAQTANPLPNLLPLNTEKVSEFEKHIEDAQRSSAPQAEAALLREQKQLAEERPTPGQPFPSSPYGTPVTSPSSAGAYPPNAYASALPQAGEHQPTVADGLKDERQKREYLSLFSDNVALTYRFSDNVALTYRKDGKANSANGVQPLSTSNAADPITAQDPLVAQAAAELARQGQLLAQMQQQAIVPSPRPSNSPASGTPIAVQNNENAKPTSIPATPTQAANASNSDAHKSYVLFEGTVLESVLINRLDGSFSGPVECLISNDFYSHDRQHLLIPAGAKVLGQAAKVDTFGQARLAVTFHRLIMPDGYSVSLDQFHSSVWGLDQQGATALKDKVNNHYARIFGASLALGVLGGAAQLGTGNLLNETAGDRIRQGFGTGMADAGEQILNRFLNILPTVTIREGTRVKIYLSGDLLLPDYHDHRLPPNL